MQPWSPLFKKDAISLEQIQRLSMRMIKGHGGKLPDDVEAYGTFSLEICTTRETFIEACKILNGLTKENTENISMHLMKRSNRSNAIKLQKERHRLEVRSNFFSSTVVNHWGSFNEELVRVQSAKLFEILLDAKFGRRIF